jgi:hypothetical protein
MVADLRHVEYLFGSETEENMKIRQNHRLVEISCFRFSLRSLGVKYHHKKYDKVTSFRTFALLGTRQKQ